MMSEKKIRILAISGSLRQTSSNTALIITIQKMVPENTVYTIFNGLGKLPHFNDAEELSVEVVEWRRQLKEANAVLICTPEYAFGVPGSLKNALDWTVSSGELVGKPLALITAATGGDKAHAAFLQIFTALSANIPEGCALLIPFVRTKLNAAGEITDASTNDLVKVLLRNLIKAGSTNTPL